MAQQDARFAFGKNWNRFLAKLDQERIEIAQRSISDMLGTTSLEGKSFIDVGRGSGLSSLAARNLGADVHSFDYDEDSVQCARILRERYHQNDEHWFVEQGSILDDDYIAGIGQKDVVMSWGVLHHTGDMMHAFENVHRMVADGGQLYIAIYNDAGFSSKVWKKIKYLYNKSTAWKYFFLALLIPMYFTKAVLTGLYYDKNPFKVFRDYKYRGMSITHDWVDWIGGYPFEVGAPDLVIHFFMDRGLRLEKIKYSREGCSEFVFRKEPVEA